MENKHVGFIIIGISAVVIVIVFLYQKALREIVGLSCSAAEHSSTCPMFTTITQQTYLSLSIVGILVIIGLAMIFNKPKEKIIVRKVKERIQKKKVDLEGFRQEDKSVFMMIQEKGAMFQADLIEKTGFGKAKMTRIIDRLEGKDLVERRRRGMTNIIVLKER